MSLTCERLMEFYEDELEGYREYKKAREQVEDPADKLRFFQMALDEKLHAGFVIGMLRAAECIDKEGQNELWRKFTDGDKG